MAGNDSAVRGAGWTGGQLSLVRLCAGVATLGVGLAAALGPARHEDLPHGLAALAADAPWRSVTLLLLALAALALALGWRHRAAAVVAGFAWLLLVAGGALPPLALHLLSVLAVFALLPPAPYGSLAAIGRTDPGGGWTFPGSARALALAALALAYVHGGVAMSLDADWTTGTALAARIEESPWLPRALAGSPDALRLFTWVVLALELAVAPLLLWRRTRRVAWSVGLALQVGAVVVDGTVAPRIGLLLLHLLVFEPAWVRARGADRVERLFYDGHCGLCHRWIRLVLAEDGAGRTFRFAPLEGPTFERELDAAERRGLPDSIVVRRADGALLVRSAAARHVLARLGGLWRALGAAAAIVPRPLADLAYDAVAAVRHRIFRRPPESCPILPARLRRRFDP